MLEIVDCVPADEVVTEGESVLVTELGLDSRLVELLCETLGTADNVEPSVAGVRLVPVADAKV